MFCGNLDVLFYFYFFLKQRSTVLMMTRKKKQLLISNTEDSGCNSDISPAKKQQHRENFSSTIADLEVARDLADLADNGDIDC